MIYDHVVNFNGVYYKAGENVPNDNEKGKEESLPFSDAEIEFETSPHKYTKEELEELSVRKIKQLAEDVGIEISKVIKGDVINEFLEKQG